MENKQISSLMFENTWSKAEVLKMRPMGPAVSETTLNMRAVQVFGTQPRSSESDTLDPGGDQQPLF